MQTTKEVIIQHRMEVKANGSIVFDVIGSDSGRTYRVTLNPNGTFGCRTTDEKDKNGKECPGHHYAYKGHECYHIQCCLAYELNRRGIVTSHAELTWKQLAGLLCTQEEKKRETAPLHNSGKPFSLLK
jgi:hypothetical protein